MEKTPMKSATTKTTVSSDGKNIKLSLFSKKEDTTPIYEIIMDTYGALAIGSQIVHEASNIINKKILRESGD